MAGQLHHGAGRGWPQSVGSWVWRHREGLAYLVLLAAALGMRLWDLGSRAMHHDESLHALYSWYLVQGNGYIHNPLMHGPFQFHGTAFVYFLFGSGEATARLLPALFGTALVGLPFLFRGFLGRTGALVTAFLLAFSPTMLYFSRFARNDIYMAVWALALVIMVWRYLDTSKRRYLFLVAALLALLFATKETAFIVTLIVGGFLFLLALPDLVPWLLGRIRLSEFSPAGVLLLLFGTLTLPLWAALLGLLQGPMGITVANEDWGQGPIGAPLGTGLFVAAATLIVLLALSVAVGIRWNKRLWPLLALTFYGIWVFLFTTFFTNFFGGIASGAWESLGYWVVQQDVARGGQPWYYYFVIGGTYEFLPLGFAGIAAVYFLYKGDLFDKFLVYWAVLTFLAYTVAGEKMPWLLVNVALPSIVLAGKFLGRLLEQVPWRWVARHGGLVLLGVAPVTVAFLLRNGVLALREPRFYADAAFWLLLALAGGIILVAAYMLRSLPRAYGVPLIALGLALLMVPLTVQTGVRASYQNGDVPVEMLVYTQTSPDIPDVMRRIDRMAQETGKGREELQILVDSTDGYTWPWAWYLRDYKRVEHRCLSRESGCGPLTAPAEADVVLLNSRNKAENAPQLQGYRPVLEYRHRWWFPESYRGLSPGGITDALRTRRGWSGPVDYFLFRSFGAALDPPSIKAIAYFPDGYTPAARTVGELWLGRSAEDEDREED